jgi:hypothetical protein
MHCYIDRYRQLLIPSVSAHNSPAEYPLLLAEEEETARAGVPDTVCMSPSHPLTTGGPDCRAKQTSSEFELRSPPGDSPEVE